MGVRVASAEVGSLPTTMDGTRAPVGPQKTGEQPMLSKLGSVHCRVPPPMSGIQRQNAPAEPLLTTVAKRQVVQDLNFPSQ